MECRLRKINHHLIVGTKLKGHDVDGTGEFVIGHTQAEIMRQSELSKPEKPSGSGIQ